MQKGENWDNIFAEDITNHLLEEQNNNNEQMIGSGLDLVALNIQRGRDHGIPSYNALRERFQVGSGRARTFSDFGEEMSEGKKHQAHKTSNAVQT